MDFNKIIKSKYPYMKDDEIELFVSRAKSICIEQLYPADLSINYENFDWENNKRFDTWLLDCVDELIERVGLSSVISYKENNMSWTFSGAGVSKELLARIPRIARACSVGVSD